MATKLRIELSKSNPYYLSPERRYELIHYCRQYREWQELYRECIQSMKGFDPVFDIVALRELYLAKIQSIEHAANMCDPYLCEYILIAVTEGRSYNYLKTVLDIPCCKRTFYVNYHKFFYELDKLLIERELHPLN